MSAIATALPAWVQGIRDFQRLGLVNKAVIDVTAVDIPFIAMAKNKTEQKERILRQVLILVIAFILAPLARQADWQLHEQACGPCGRCW